METMNTSNPVEVTITVEPDFPSICDEDDFLEENAFEGKMEKFTGLADESVAGPPSEQTDMSGETGLGDEQKEVNMKALHPETNILIKREPIESGDEEERGFEQVFIKEEMIDPDEFAPETHSENEDQNSTLNASPSFAEEERPSTSAQPSSSWKPSLKKRSLDDSDNDPDYVEEIMESDSECSNKEISHDFPDEKPRNNKTFQCSECNQCFSRKSNLVRHMPTHSGSKPYKCPDCSKQFSQLNHLNTHARTHTGEKPFECNECKKQFSQLSHLNSHTLTHTGSKSFKCAECDLRFSRKSNLRRHTQVHSSIKSDYMQVDPEISQGVKSFSCDKCNQRYAHKCNLKRHMRIHEGGKPFECSECSKGFIQACHLTEHMRIHSGEKPFECNMCNARFSLKGTLNRHLRTHTGERPFECSACNQRFSTRSNLTDHQLRIHWR